MSRWSTSATPFESHLSSGKPQVSSRQKWLPGRLDVFQTSAISAPLGHFAKSYRVSASSSTALTASSLRQWISTLVPTSAHVPYVFPGPNSSNNFTPPATLLSSAQSHTSLNFAPAVPEEPLSASPLSIRTPPLNTFSSGAPSVEKSLGRATTLEVRAISARAAFISSALTSSQRAPGPGAIGPRAADVSRVRKRHKLAQRRTVRRRPHRLSRLAALHSRQHHQPAGNSGKLDDAATSTCAAVTPRPQPARQLHLFQELSNAPDSARQFESSIPQNDSNLAAEKGARLRCGHRFAASLCTYPSVTRERLLHAVTRNWNLPPSYQIRAIPPPSPSR